MSVRGLALGAALVLTLSGCSMPDATPSTPPAGLTVLALGDSYTIGEGVAPDQTWPVRMAAALRADGTPVADPLVIAQTGWTTDELDAGIDARAAEMRVPYDLVTLLIGVNDQYRGRTASEVRTRFRDLLARAVAFAGGDAGRVVVVSIPDWGVTPFAASRDAEAIAQAIDAVNAVARDEAARAGAAFVDITPLSRTQGSLVVGDDLHPTGEAYAAWTARIVPVARAALAPL